MTIDGEKLIEILASDEAYAILDRSVGGSWLAGGCLLLARSLKRLLPGSCLVIMHGRVGEGVGGPQHCVLSHRGLYVDANGIQTEEDLLRHWRDEEGVERPFLRPHGGEDLGEIISDEGSEKDLAALLAAAVT